MDFGPISKTWLSEGFKALPARGVMFLGVHVAVWLYQQMHFWGMEGH